MNPNAETSETIHHTQLAQGTLRHRSGLAACNGGKTAKQGHVDHGLAYCLIFATVAAAVEPVAVEQGCLLDIRENGDEPITISSRLGKRRFGHARTRAGRIITIALSVL